MKTILEIEDFEDKKTTSNKDYTRFKTSQGWMSCFDNKSCNELKKLQGKNVNVEIKESGDFKNIKKFISEASEDIEISAESPNGKVVRSPEIEKVVKNGSNTKKEMYVSYAKDAFCAIVTRISQAKFDDMEKEEVLKLMDLSIKAIKKAESAF